MVHIAVSLVALVETLCFKIIWIIYQLIQNVVWRISGIHAAKEKNRSGEKCAQLLDIKWKYKPDVIMVPPSLSDFIMTHNSFVRPDYVLQDHVSLYQLTETEAIFVEADPSVDVTHSSTHFFMYSAQYIHAKRLIRMPIESLIKLSEELGDPEGTVLFLSSTGRCGSTLFCQMFEQTGQSVCFSEPSIFMLGLQLPEKDVKERLSASIRILCKPRQDMDIQAFIIKLPAFSVSMVPLFIELFPESKQLFMYRDGMKVANSYHQLVQRFRLGAIFKLTNIPTRILAKKMGMTIHPAAREMFDSNTMHFYLWAYCCYKYMSFYEDGLKIGGVRHEDLVSSPVESSRSIMTYCGLPEDWALSVVKAMGKDSMQSLKAKNQPVSSIDLDPKVPSTFCEIFGLPHHSSVLPGTITKHQ